MINAISGQIYRNTFKENRDDLLLEEMINMLCFTLDRTTNFPSKENGRDLRNLLIFTQVNMQFLRKVWVFY